LQADTETACSALDAELLVGELRQLRPDRYPHASAAAASLIERALEGERAAPAISIDASQQPPVVRALEALLSGRRAFSEGLGDLLEILFAETPAFDLSRPIVKEQSQIDEMRAALRGDRERAEARRQAAGESRRVSARKAADYLCAEQEANGDWSEEHYTGTGFPTDFMIRYHLYRLHFPLLALGRLRERLNA
jgi:squalene-hopene cyclase-like protein